MQKSDQEDQLDIKTKLLFFTILHPKITWWFTIYKPKNTYHNNNKKPSPVLMAISQVLGRTGMFLPSV